jgi:hypothetical protein
MPSDLKKLGVVEGLTVYSIGGIMYLFMPQEKTNRVVISAHGGREKTTLSFRVQTDVVLQFYSADTNSVLDPGMMNFYFAEAAPKEIITEGDLCYNYTLSKYQGKDHNKMGETYQTIARAIGDCVRGKRELLAGAQKATSEKAKSKLLQGAAKNKPAAVLTIRNRWFRSEVNLSYAIDQVKRISKEIVIFDCLFCRSMEGGGSDSVPLISR